MRKQVIALGLALMMGQVPLSALAVEAGAAPQAAETADGRVQIAQFPFNDQQPLTPEQVKIQKYKLERLRIQMLRDDWYIIRGINERIDDLTLLKMTGRTSQIEEENFRKTVGGYTAMGGLAVAAIGGLLLADLFKFSNSSLIGIGLVLAGGATAIGAELWAGNIVGEENPHLVDRPEAEQMVKEYNEKLKKDLGVENVPNLE